MNIRKLQSEISNMAFSLITNIAVTTVMIGQNPTFAMFTQNSNFMPASTSVENPSFCQSVDSNQVKLCLEMKYLRTQLMVLGAQRDLLQINYPLLAQVAIEIKESSERSLEAFPEQTGSHAFRLLGVQASAGDMFEMSQLKNGDALMAANRIQNQCNGCHSQSSPTSGRNWNEIFKSDWGWIVDKCNDSEHNPYRCKAMYGMFSYYGGLFAGLSLGRQNFELVGLSMSEINKLAQSLRENQFFIGQEKEIQEVESESLRIKTMAEKKDPEVFNQISVLTISCMKCHSDQSSHTPYDRNMESVVNPLSFSSVNQQNHSILKGSFRAGVEPHHSASSVYHFPKRP